MKIEVQYNEFRNWPTHIKVRHPDCEHETTTTYDIVVSGDRYIGQGVCCVTCEAVQVPTYDDEDYTWINN